jgi:putative SOS response-associated peptidase YedK
MSAQHFEQPNYVILPALWGLIPRWHKGNFREHGFNTINFGLENLDTSRMYKPAFNRGQRCVLVCEGYYEHQRVPYRLPPEERSIYYVHTVQTGGVKIDDKSTWDCRSINLLYIAGIFDIWTDDEGFEIYNFTILSQSSEGNKLSMMHPRTPVILEGSQQIRAWLDFNQIVGADALELIQKPKNVIFYEVSKHVLDANHKDSKCNQPIANDNDDDDDDDE